MAKNSDPVVGALSAAAASAVAPVMAGVELATTGKVSNETGTRVVTGAIGDVITGK